MSSEPDAAWKREYVAMSEKYNRELRRLVALADLFEDWLIAQGYNSLDAGQLVSWLYAEATDKVEARATA